MKLCRCLIILAVVLLALSPAGAAAPALTLQQAEKRLVRGGYLDTLMAADWAVRPWRLYARYCLEPDLSRYL